MYILTSPFTKTFDTLWLLYFVPDFLEDQIWEGAIVEVPIWTKIENAVVLEIVKNLENFCVKYEISISEEKIKSVTWVVTQTQFISKNNIILAQFISEHYFTQIHNAINLFFPAIVRKKILWVDEKFFKKLTHHQPLPCKEKSSKKFNKLSGSQEKAYNTIKHNFKIPPSKGGLGGAVFENLKLGGDLHKKINLLYWITWSWKTEIYIHLIKKNLEKNKQSLLLIPEIILNNQIWEKLINTFWENVIIINSSITDTKRAKYFGDIYSWKAKIIIWTRSALFYPYKNLELIIMDEEHDNSYNSDKSPRYKTKEILEKMLGLNPNINILLGSWTPSINSMYKAVKGEWNLINLLEMFTSSSDSQ